MVGDAEFVEFVEGGEAGVDGEDGEGGVGPVFGDGFVWGVGDGRCRFDPVADVRVLAPGERVVSVGWLEAVIEQAAAALGVLERVGAQDLSVEEVEVWALGVERLRRQADAASVAVAGHVDVAEPFREQGYFTAKTWMKQRLQLSGPEAYARVQCARFRRRCPMWANAEAAGQIGVAQMQLMARIAANPRIPGEVLERGCWLLLPEAMDEPYAVFERRARTWEALADPAGDAATAERNRQRRCARMAPRPDGGWELHAGLDGVAGAEFFEIFAFFVDAEFHADWAEARERLALSGEPRDVTVGDLSRTEPQRHADALVAMARAAATAPAGVGRPVPTLNVLCDIDTVASTVLGEPVPPERFRDIVCRTERGQRLNTADAVNTMLWGLIRRVVTDSASVVIDLGRRSRLFTGSARDAVMLLHTECVWVGCDRPTSWCDADHSLSWRAHGASVPRNGQPLCPRHNRLKEHGFHVHRDNHGHWHTIDPDGNEIA